VCPYDVGDLWTAGINGDLKYCITARAAGQSYNAADWAVASPYTRNIITYSSVAPGSPTNGDVWIDTSVTPNLIKLRVSGVWQVGGNYTTNTNQLTDGAGLGTTSTWTGVSGAGKPADGATKNLIYRQTSAPTGGTYTTGDLWVDTDANPLVIYQWNGSSWVAISNYATSTSQLADDAGLGATATWANITGAGKPADNADVTLSALNGGLSVTGTGIILASTAAIKSGQTDYAAGTGFFIGMSGGVPKFSVGSDANFMRWDGSAMSIGGCIISNDGANLVLIGRKLTGTGTSTQYPPDTPTYMTADAQIHIYYWSYTWIEVATLGVSTIGSDKIAIQGMRGSATAQGVGVRGQADDSSGIGIYGVGSNNIGVYGTGKYGVVCNGNWAPLRIWPWGYTTPPNHAADKGSIVVNSNGDSYINVSGSSGYGAWRTLGCSSLDLTGYALADGSMCMHVVDVYTNLVYLMVRYGGAWTQCYTQPGGGG